MKSETTNEVQVYEEYKGITRPMLAAKVTDLELLEYPLWVSPKLDGIRCLVHPELGAVSRQFKPIPNQYIRTVLGQTAAAIYMDGELMTYTLVDGVYEPDQFNTIQSKVMSESGCPVFSLRAFDYFKYPKAMWLHRYVDLVSVIESYQWDDSPQVGKVEIPNTLQVVTHNKCNDATAAAEAWQRHTGAGHEGICLRQDSGPYKSGRSTLRQQWLLKYKEYADMEVTIVGVEPLQTNNNPQMRDILGLAKRSKSKEGKAATEKVGKFITETPDGRVVAVGSGLSENERTEYWHDRDKLIGKMITIEYQPSGGKDLPRFPIFKGFRNPIDG